LRGRRRFRDGTFAAGRLRFNENDFFDCCRRRRRRIPHIDGAPLSASGLEQQNNNEDGHSWNKTHFHNRWSL
jgi:hypothetical protein